MNFMRVLAAKVSVVKIPAQLCVWSPLEAHNDAAFSEGCMTEAMQLKHPTTPPSRIREGAPDHYWMF